MTLSLLQIGLGGLTAAQGSLATTSHNIANANTPEFSRQQAVLTNVGGVVSGAGFFGEGVAITAVRRSYDQFLAGALQDLSSRATAHEVRSEAMAQLDALFADAEQGLGAGMDQVWGALGDVANRPTETATRQVALARIELVAQRFNAVGAQVASAFEQAQARLVADAGQVNARVDELRLLNAQIQQADPRSGPPNDVLDQRDRALLALGQLVPVRPVPAADGTISLFLPGGAPLLVGQSAARLEAAPLPGDPTRLGLRLQLGAVSQWLDDASLQGGGSLGATLSFRDQDLQAVATRLDTLARGFADALNTQHALGVDAAGQAGQALLAYDAAALRPPGLATSLRATALAPSQLATGQAAIAQPALGNTGSARVASFAVVRAPADVAQPVTLVFADPPDRFSLLGLAGGDLLDQPYTPGQAVPSAPGDLQGWRLVLEGAPAAGDRFEILRNPAPGADNRNALALQGLARQPIAGGATAAQGYAALVAEVGTRTQSARDQATVAGQMQADARTRKESISGVNLDEEAAALLRHQQAYQACARVLQASQALFDSLLSATGR